MTEVRNQRPESPIQLVSFGDIIKMERANPQNGFTKKILCAI
jgi:hypothetical protein